MSDDMTRGPLLNQRNRTACGGPLTPGVNVDRVDIAAGLTMAKSIGYDSDEAEMIVVYALQRWARGEEEGADRTALGYPIDLTSWRMILAAALAGASEDPL